MSVTLFMGGYGSGKSELALDLCLRRAAGENTAFFPPASAQKRVILLDMDVINPAFRSHEKREMLTQRGVEVYAPSLAGSTLDIPALPAALGALIASDADVVIDVGGDPDGAGVLGRYHDDLAGVEKTVWFVLNPYRLRQENSEKAWALMAAICDRARLAPTALIANPNLGRDTTPELIAQGMAVIRETAQLLGLPIAALAVEAHRVPHLEQSLCREFEGRLWPLESRMRPTWLDATQES